MQVIIFHAGQGMAFSEGRSQLAGYSKADTSRAREENKTNGYLASEAGHIRHKKRRLGR